MPNLVFCPNCGAHYDTSSRYTSPENRAGDRVWWLEEHLSGRCVTDHAEVPAHGDRHG